MTSACARVSFWMGISKDYQVYDTKLAGSMFLGETVGVGAGIRVLSCPQIAVGSTLEMYCESHSCGGDLPCSSLEQGGSFLPASSRKALLSAYVEAGRRARVDARV